MSTKKRILIIATILFIGLIIIGSTYAFWAWNSNINKNVIFNTASELKKYIVYDEGNSKFTGNFEATNSFNQGMHSTVSVYKTAEANDTDLFATIHMSINEIGINMRESQALKWVVTGGTSINIGSVLASGNFVGVNNADTLDLVTNLEVTTTETFYTIWIWLDASANPSNTLIGKTLDTNVWTEITQLEGAEDRYEITRVIANYQTINASVVDTQYKITNYAITSSNVTPSVWTSIPSSDQNYVYNIPPYNVNEIGTYYVWFKDSANRTISKSVEVTDIDNTSTTTEYTAIFKYQGSSTPGVQNISIVSTSCTAANTAENCTVNIPNEVINSAGKYTNEYAGLTNTYGTMNASINKNETTITLSANQTYYAIYSSEVTIYYPNSLSTCTSGGTYYRNQWFDSDATLSTTVLSDSITGTSNFDVANQSFGSSNSSNISPYGSERYVTSANSLGGFQLSQIAQTVEENIYVVYNTTITGTFYYNSGATANEPYIISSAEATVKRYLHCTTTTTATVNNSTSYVVPTVAANSVGPYNTTLVGWAASTNTMNTTMTNASKTTFYAVYRGTVYNQYYNNNTNDYEQMTLYRNVFFNSNIAMKTVLSETNTGTSNYITAGGPNGSTWVGLSTAADATAEYNSVAAAATSNHTAFYTLYAYTIDYSVGTNVSSVGKANDTCNIYAGVATCTVTLPSITPNSGYAIEGWSNSAKQFMSLGDYVSYTPTKTSYKTDTSQTGYSSAQTINPSELNVWRVININSNGTIELISDKISSTSVYFVGKTGYTNLVGYLNTLAKQYANSDSIVTSTRYFGYNGQTEWVSGQTFGTYGPWSCQTDGIIGNCSPSDADNYEAQGGGDTLYNNDYDLVTTALGTAAARTTSNTAGTYWVASRYYGITGYDNQTSVYYTLVGRAILSDGTITKNNNLFNSANNQSITRQASLRPIIILASTAQITGGSGTSDSPYTVAGGDASNSPKPVGETITLTDNTTHLYANAIDTISPTISNVDVPFSNGVLPVTVTASDAGSGLSTGGAYGYGLVDSVNDCNSSASLIHTSSNKYNLFNSHQYTTDEEKKAICISVTDNNKNTTYYPYALKPIRVFYLPNIDTSNMTFYEKDSNYYGAIDIGTGIGGTCGSNLCGIQTYEGLDYMAFGHQSGPSYSSFEPDGYVSTMIPYGQVNNLRDYHNPLYMYINKAGAYAKPGAEWNTKANGTGVSFGQDKEYSYQELYENYMSILYERPTYYELDLYVNWVNGDSCSNNQTIKVYYGSPTSESSSIAGTCKTGTSLNNSGSISQSNLSSGTCSLKTSGTNSWAAIGNNWAYWEYSANIDFSFYVPYLSDNSYMQFTKPGYVSDPTYPWYVSDTNGPNGNREYIYGYQPTPCSLMNAYKKIESGNTYYVNMFVNWVKKPLRIYYNANGGSISGYCNYYDLNANVCYNDANGWATIHDVNAHTNGQFWKDIHISGEAGDDIWSYQMVKPDTTINLWNYDIPEWLNITRSGYHAKSGAEYNTRSDGTGTSFSDDADLTYATLVASATEKPNYYELDLYVNWEAN